MPFALHAAYWRNRFGEPQRGARQRRLRSSPLESTHDHAMHPRSGRRIAVIDTTDREGSFVGRRMHRKRVRTWVRAVGSARHLSRRAVGSSEGRKVYAHCGLELDDDADEFSILRLDGHAMCSRNRREMQVHERRLRLVVAEHGWAQECDGFENSDAAVEERRRIRQQRRVLSGRPQSLCVHAGGVDARALHRVGDPEALLEASRLRRAGGGYGFEGFELLPRDPPSGGR